VSVLGWTRTDEYGWVNGEDDPAMLTEIPLLDLLDAIDAEASAYAEWFDNMPDSWTPSSVVVGYAQAMRRIKALLHPEDGGQ
jgi:hypothetical protein